MNLDLYILSYEYGHLSVNTSRSSLSLVEASAITSRDDVQACRRSCSAFLLLCLSAEVELGSFRLYRAELKAWFMMGSVRRNLLVKTRSLIKR